MWVVVRYRPGCNSYFGLYYRFAASSIFAVVYSMAIQARPEKANEISGLMITGVAGGAIAPPLMGICADAVGGQGGSVIIIAICTAYLLFCSYGIKVAKK